MRHVWSDIGSSGSSSSKSLCRFENVTKNAPPMPPGFRLLGAERQVYENERAVPPKIDPIVDWPAFLAQKHLYVLIHSEGAARAVRGVPEEVSRFLSSSWAFSHAYLLRCDQLSGRVKLAAVNPAECLYGRSILTVFFLEYPTNEDDGEEEEDGQV
jgi:hypothetical protein